MIRADLGQIAGHLNPLYAVAVVENPYICWPKPDWRASRGCSNPYPPSKSITEYDHCGCQNH
jgi:hypothetical protein